MGSKTFSLKRRALATVGVVALLGVGGFVLPTSPSADAHTCARVEVNGIGAGTGGCHAPPCPDDHHGTGGSDSIGSVKWSYVVCI